MRSEGQARFGHGALIKKSHSAISRAADKDVLRVVGELETVDGVHFVLALGIFYAENRLACLYVPAHDGR